MNATIAVAAIPAATAIIVAAFGYILNKRLERDAEWRKLKLRRYQEWTYNLHPFQFRHGLNRPPSAR